MKLITILNKIVESGIIAYGVNKIVELTKNYIKDNNPDLITQLKEMLIYDTDYKSLLTEKYKNNSILYRGIGGKGPRPSTDEILFTEKEQLYKSTTKSYDIAKKYALSDKPSWSYIIQYNTNPNTIILDIDLYNTLHNVNIKNEEEVIINIHECVSLEIITVK